MRDAFSPVVARRFIIIAGIGTDELLGALINPTTTITPDTSPRGVKRSRSPDTYGDLPGDNIGDDGMLLSLKDLAQSGIYYLLVSLHVSRCYNSRAAVL